MLFITWLRLHQNLAPTTIASYVAAVRSLHIDLGVPDPTRGADCLARLLRGVRRNCANPSPPRLPITNSLMRLIKQALAPSLNNVMFWAASCSAYFGFLRVSEFTCPSVLSPSKHLALHDLTFDPAGF